MLFARYNSSPNKDPNLSLFLCKYLTIKIIISIFSSHRREVLEQYKSDGLDRMGPIKPTLALCVFAVFILVYFSLWKGVRSTGKVSLIP